MNIHFSTISCEPEYVNKQMYIAYSPPFSAPVSCVARYPLDILNPVVTIEVPSGTSIHHYNYFYIQELGRYYYITSMIAVSNSLWEVSGHIDVLYTYRNQILNNSAIISRQENQYNIDLADSELVVSAGREFLVEKFPNADGIVPASSTSRSFVLTVAGGYLDPGNS